MAKRCRVSQRRFRTSNTVTFSNKHNRRRQDLNLQTKRLWDPETNSWVRVQLSVRMLKTISKYGLRATLKKYETTQLVRPV
ncbi:MAG: 50S ribosomal protein L28 [Vampirovibrionales bacterium]|nr:50S ribosomal protein L28 [Vampirovibrionales bacterium]